jgi:hypothetical protein
MIAHLFAALALLSAIWIGFAIGAAWDRRRIRKALKRAIYDHAQDVVSFRVKAASLESAPTWTPSRPPESETGG